jgi:hypothetical protein
LPPPRSSSPGGRGGRGRGRAGEGQRGCWRPRAMGADRWPRSLRGGAQRRGESGWCEAEGSRSRSSSLARWPHAHRQPGAGRSCFLLWAAEAARSGAAHRACPER